MKRAYNFETENAEFIQTKLARLPKHWRENARVKYIQLLGSMGVRAANDYLTELIEPLENLLNIAHDDNDIKALADELSQKCFSDCRDFGGLSNDYLLKMWGELCLAYSVRFPSELAIDDIGVRVCDATWWLRNLRNSHARAREVAAINGGLVHAKANKYCSDDTLERRTQQLARNKQLLASITMESESGERMSLQDVADSGMANQVNRQSELVTRVKGFEEVANLHGHKSVFVTLTCPSRMHAITSNGKPNQKYDGTKPDEAQKYLVHCWAKARAKLARAGIQYYGLRVAEPHHDGCPHWHMVLFYDVQHKSGLVDAIRFYFLQDSWDEAGAQKNRVKFEHINPLKGSAVAYVLKYILKNLNGIDENHIDAVDGKEIDLGKNLHARVEAWAATWRIRQFQQLGGHSVTVWRELRRVTEETVLEAGRQIFTAWQACQKRAEKQANFAQFILAMGGIERPAKKSLIRVDDDYVMREGKYGKAAVRIFNGVIERFGLNKAENNRQTWHRV